MNNFLIKIRYRAKQAMLLMLLLLFGMGSAHAIDFALDVHAGSNGAGVGGTVGVNAFINLRAGINTFEYGEDYEEDGVDYTADFEFDNRYLLLDFHPFTNSFRITVGLYSNDNAIEGFALVDATTVLGEGADTINFSDAGRANLRVKYDSSTAPYIGIGFGNAVRDGGGLGFSFDLGVIDTGSLEASISLDNAAQNAAIGDINAALAAEVEEANQEFDDLDVWPLLQLGISYGF